MSIIALLQRGRRASAGRPAVVTEDAEISYDEFLAAVRRTACALNQHGFGVGDRIAVLSPNDPAALIASYGVMASGATYVPVSATNGWRDVQSALLRFDCRSLIYHDSMVAAVEKFHDDLPDTITLMRMRGADRDLGASACAGDRLLDDLQDAAVDSIPRTPALTDIAWLGLTGGTTGSPKGVQVSWVAMNAFVQKFVGEFPTRNPKTLVATPLTHGAGMLAMGSFARGGTVVVAKGLVASQYLSMLEQHEITEAFLPPTGIYKLLDDESVRTRDYRALQHLIYAAAPMSLPRLREAIGVFGPVLTQMYGQTECHTMISVMKPEDHFADGDIHGQVADDARLSGCGWPSLGTIIEIRDDNGRQLPTGELGEICVSSDLNMSGYYNAPEETAVTLQNGFVHTGDIGYLDADGCVHIVDRKKDMVITGGFNVYPAEIEPVLRRRPEIADCAVVGIPDDYWGETLVAAVQLTHGAEIDAADVIADIRDELGPIKTPKHIVVLDQLPLTGLGKILKKDVRAAVITALEKTDP
ncbi:class I adenylate-forming enzyme family protein [Nocardia fluminea]|uniref:class I adenylate-forming enzyme family protein n=1 Tax=Nocardia fluminea TaxID=134984 RepID=UPI003D0BA634